MTIKVLEVKKCGHPCGYYSYDNWNEAAICGHPKLYKKNDIHKNIYIDIEKNGFPKICPLKTKEVIKKNVV